MKKVIVDNYLNVITPTFDLIVDPCCNLLAICLLFLSILGLPLVGSADSDFDNNVSGS